MQASGVIWGILWEFLGYTAGITVVPGIPRGFSVFQWDSQPDCGILNPPVILYPDFTTSSLVSHVLMTVRLCDDVSSHISLMITYRTYLLYVSVLCVSYD